jgi:hypothetical protein
MSITSAAASGKVQCVFSQTEGANTLGFTNYFPQTPNGNCNYQGPGNAGYGPGAGGVTALNTPCIFVMSYDSTTGIARSALNGLPTNSVALTGTRPMPGSSDVFRIFGNVSDNGDFTLCKFETFAILNAAAGAGYAIDPLLTAAIASMRGVYGF